MRLTATTRRGVVAGLVSALLVGLLILPALGSNVADVLIESMEPVSTPSQLVEGEVVRVEVAVPGAASIKLLKSGLAGDQGLFFLREKSDAKGIYRFVSTQGALVEAGGKISSPLWTEETFPTNLDGLSPDELVRAVETPSAVPGIAYDDGVAEHGEESEYPSPSPVPWPVQPPMPTATPSPR